MASSLQETKAFLLLAGRHLSSAYSSVSDSLPSHINTIDEPLRKELHQLQADVRNMIAKANKLAGQI